MRLKDPLEKTARLLSGKYGLRVVRGVPATDGKVVSLPIIPDPSPEFMRMLQGWLDHEVLGHLLHSTFGEKAKKSATKDWAIDMVSGAIEDIRVDSIVARKYLGGGENLEALRIEQDKEYLEKEKKMPLHTRALIALISVALGRNKVTDYDKDVQKMLAKIKDLIPLMPDLPDTKAAREMAKDVVKRWKMKDSPDQPQPPQQKSNQEMQGSASQKNESGDGEDDQDDKPSSGKGNGKGKNKEKKEQEENDEDEQDGDEQEKDDSSGNEKDNSSGNEKDNDDEDDDFSDGEDDFQPEDSGATALTEQTASETETFLGGMDVSGALARCVIAKHYMNEMRKFAEDRHIPFSTEFDEVEELWKTTTVGYNGRLYESEASMKEEVKPITRRLVNRLERILVANEKSRWLGNLQSAHYLDQDALWKLASGTSDRIFKKKIDGKKRNVAVSLVIDCSGSMGGHKIKCARRAAFAFHLALEGFGIEHEVIGFAATHENALANAWETYYQSLQNDEAREAATKTFSRLYEKLIHFIAKPFGSKRHNIMALDSQGCNCDPESVMFAAKRLEAMPQERKVMMVFSDGWPSVYDGTMGHFKINNELRLSVQHLESLGVEVIGIGIQSNAVKNFYPKSVVIHKPDDLTGEVLKRIEQFLIAPQTKKFSKTEKSPGIEEVP